MGFICLWGHRATAHCAHTKDRTAYGYCNTDNLHFDILKYVYHFMNMYRLYIAWYRPILLMFVGCINWYFRNKTLFLWLKSPYFHFTDTGLYYQCLKIKNYAVYNIHRLAWGSFAFGTTGQLSIVPIHKTALRRVTLILIMFISTF
jgi:hypothetical protein